MSEVIVHVWHTVSGQIVAVGRPQGGAMCVPLAGEKQAVLETKIEEEHIQGLHETHVVDVVRRAIVPHSGRKT